MLDLDIFSNKKKMFQDYLQSNDLVGKRLTELKEENVKLNMSLTSITLENQNLKNNISYLKNNENTNMMTEFNKIENTLKNVND